MIHRRALLAAAAVSGLLAPPVLLASPARAASRPWPEIEAAARGQTVFFNAWGGDDRTNAFIAWADERMRMLHGVGVLHVRLFDTAEAVTRVIAEKAAGRAADGSVDMIWINGANFLTMKQRYVRYCRNVIISLVSVSGISVWLKPTA